MTIALGPKPDLRVYAVLDPARCRGRDPVALAAAAAAGGATLLQLRHKTGSTRELVQLAAALRGALDPYAVPLIVNDRVDVALATDAAGCHVGRTDMGPDDARRLLGPAAFLGVTVHHGHEAQAMSRGLASYAGLGPVFSTESKDPGDPPLTPSGLHRLVEAVRLQLGDLPVCAIAGVDATNAGAVIEAGADGVAVISAIFMADDVQAATARLREVVDRSLVARAKP